MARSRRRFPIERPAGSVRVEGMVGTRSLGPTGSRSVDRAQAVELTGLPLHNRRQSGVAIHALDVLGALVTHQRVRAIVTPKNPFRRVAPCTVEAARTGADRPGCCLRAALRATPCRRVGRQIVGRTVVRALS